MAVTLTQGLPANTTLGASNVVTRFDPPSIFRRLRITFRTNDGKWSRDPSLSDAGALGASTYETLLANVAYEYDWTGGALFLASATGSTVVEVTAVP